MSPVVKKRIRLLIANVLLLLSVLVGGWVFAPAVLVVDSDPAAADALVVLGGEPWTRPDRAAEVYREIVASAPRGPLSRGPSIVVVASGNGDCQDVRRQLEAKGVPPSVIETECESKSTYENARFSVKLLREHGITNAVIVTSWYHSRRSLACFHKAAPEIRFFVRPTTCPPSGLRHPDSYTVKRVYQEYAKIVYYWVVHGVSPWE